MPVPVQTQSPYYMDTAASTPLLPEALEAMLPWLSAESGFANPSSMHSGGVSARLAVSRARAKVATCLNAAEPQHIAFTSSATEANNWVIRTVGGRWQHHNPGKKGHVVFSALEHDAVRLPMWWMAEKWGWDMTVLPVSESGHVSPQAFSDALQPNTVLASVMMVNNELGTLQPVAELARRAREAGVLFHTDAVQAVGKISVDVQALDVDFLTWSAHKFYGPKGVGGLYLHPSASLSPYILGGGQENGLRSGTEAVAQIVGMAEALSYQVAHATDYKTHLKRLEQQFVQALETAFADVPAVVVLNSSGFKTPGLVHVSVIAETKGAPMIEGEALVLQLDLQGIQASSGSACHSTGPNGAALQPSRMVRALLGESVDGPSSLAGVDMARAMGTVRFSFGWHNTPEQMPLAAQALAIATCRVLGVAVPAFPTNPVPAP